MILAGRPAKILLIDTNVYFSKRLSDALKREGFEVACSTQPAFALTTLEYDAPGAIVCSTNMREMGALDIARLVRADSKNSAMPIIALGDGSQRALMEAFQAGCDDYIDRNRPPAVIATHIRNIIISKAEGFQPTQMLSQSDTSLSGSLTHHDLPGVMQMLGHAHQTGALHINSGDTDALLFFDAGEIVHAECASLFGDEAVIHILKNCMRNNSGVYKFAYGSASPQRTVLRSATDLMLDAMREIDESAHYAQDLSSSEDSSSSQDLSSPQDASLFQDPSSSQNLVSSEDPSSFQDSDFTTDFQDSPTDASDNSSTFNSLLGLADAASEENTAITDAIDDFAAKTSDNSNKPGFSGTGLSLHKGTKGLCAETSEIIEPSDEFASNHAPEPLQSETNFRFSEDSLFSPDNFQHAEPTEDSIQANSVEQSPNTDPSEQAATPGTQLSSDLSPFANYSLIPYAGVDTEDIT